MIAIVYNGLKRFQKTANPNHQKMIERIRSKYPVTVYDFLKDSHDDNCPVGKAGPVMVYDFVQSCKIVKENIVVKFRSDLWFTESSMNTIMSEIDLIASNQLDVSFIGMDVRSYHDSEYVRVGPIGYKNGKSLVQDFCVIADKTKIDDYETIIQNVILNKDVKSGHRQHPRIIGPSTRAYTIKCQLYLIRQEYENPTDWQLGYDFVKGYNEPHAHTWFEQRKPK